MKFKIIVLLIIFISSCTTPSPKDNRSDDEIKVLIDQNKEKLLFLNFWKGINDIDFVRVKKIETQKQNLQADKFVLLIDGYNRVPFSISNERDIIVLSYKEENWVDWNGNERSSPRQYGDNKGQEYKNTNDYIIDL